MPHVTYISPDGTETTLEARVGDSVMETAVKNGVKGIVAECGGSCACATCHVGAAAERLPVSRLSCQLKMREDLDGLRINIAPEQF